MAALKRLSGGALRTRTQNQAPYQPAVLQQLAAVIMAYLTAAGLNFGRYAVVTAVI